MLVLQARELVKTFGRRRVVNGVDLEVGRREIVGLLGPNGAGKTTCFRMICGLLQPDSGRVFLGEQEVTRWPMYRRCRDGRMGYLAQESSVFRKLTVEQNLLAVMELLGMGRRRRRQRCADLLEQFKITHIRKSRAGKISGGERRRLEIARCLVSEPEVIMLDEPFAGIDPVTVQNIQTIIRQLCDDGLSILITDHAAREILQVVDRCYVIHQGSVLACGNSQEVRDHPEVRRIYLGNMDGADSIPGGGAHTGQPGPPAPHEPTLRPRRRDDLSPPRFSFLWKKRTSADDSD